MKKSVVALALASALSSPVGIAQTLQHDNKSSTEVITVIGSPITLSTSETIAPLTNNQADFGDQLVTLPGLSIARNGPVTALIQYRGMFGPRVGVTIDGVNINGAGPNAMDSPLSHVLPEPGMTATLYRGITPVSAGIETIGGQLHIQSDAYHLFNYANVPNSNEFQGSISASIVSPGSGQQYQGSGLFNTDNAFVSAAFIHQQRDERESGDGMLIPNAHYQRNGVKLRAGYEWGKHQVDISYQNLNTNESGTPALAMDIAFIDAAWYRFGYRYNQSDASYLTLSVFGNDNQHTMDNFSQRPLMMPAMARQNDTDSVAQGIDATYVMPWQDGELTLGTNLLHNRNNSIITNPNNAAFFVNNFINTERDTASIFAQWNKNTARYLTTLGTRFTRIDMDADPVNSNMVMMNSAIATLVDNFNQSSQDETYNMLDIAATFQYRVSRNTHIVIGASQKNRAPTYFERYTWLPLGITGGMADGFNYIGNLDLDNETARQIELGIDVHTDKWTFSPRFFYQDVENYITGMPSTNMAANMVSTMMTGRAPFQWTNTDAVIKGVDVELHGQLTESVSVNAVASVQHGNRDDIDDALFRIAPEQLITTVSWQTSLGNAPLSMQLISELSGRQSHVSALQNEQITAGFGLIHINASWQILPELVVTTRINNAFDKFYAPHTAGINRIMGSELPQGERVPGAGREWQLSMRYQF